MFTGRDEFLGTLDLAAKKRYTLPLEKRTRLLGLLCKLEGILDVTVAGTKVINAGSLAATITSIGIREGGEEINPLPGRVATFLSEVIAPNPMPFLRATGAGVQAATKLSEEFLIVVSNPLAALQKEIGYVMANADNTLELFVDFDPAVGTVIKGGTAALTNVKLSVTQIFDEKLDELPEYLPYARVMPRVVAGANAAETFELSNQDPIWGIIIHGETDDGDQSDIVRFVSLRSEREFVKGPRPLPWDHVIARQASLHAGDVVRNRAYGFLRFIDGGKLSTLLTRDRHPALRLILDLAPSAVGANTRVSVYLLEYKTDVGRRTRQPAIPA